MLVHRFKCKSCGNTVDSLRRDGDLACAECMDVIEFAGTVGSVRGVAEGQTPNRELRELTTEWRNHGADGRAASVFEMCADDLAELIEDD